MATSSLMPCHNFIVVIKLIYYISQTNCLGCIMHYNKAMHCAMKCSDHHIPHVRIPLTLVAHVMPTCERALA